MAPPRPPDDVYAPPRSAVEGGGAGPPKFKSDVPDGDLDAALAGAIPLRAGAAMAEGWAAVRGTKGAFLLLLLLYAPLRALPGALRAAGALDAAEVRAVDALSMPEIWPTLLAAAPLGVSLTAELIQTVVGAVYAQLTWALALRVIGGGPAQLRGLLNLRAVVGITFAALVWVLPGELGLHALPHVPEGGAAVALQALLPALTALGWGLTVWAAPLILDRELGVWQAISTSARLVLRRPWAVLALGLAMLLSTFLGGLSCWIGFLWALPFQSLTLAAAWRQLAGLRQTQMVTPDRAPD
jgi:hypothetical protein